jgi:hypothetical protein
MVSDGWFEHIIAKTHLRPVKANIITIARILMLSVSAF